MTPSIQFFASNVQDSPTAALSLSLGPSSKNIPAKPTIGMEFRGPTNESRLVGRMIPGWYQRYYKPL